MLHLNSELEQILETSFSPELLDKVYDTIDYFWHMTGIVPEYFAEIATQMSEDTDPHEYFIEQLLEENEKSNFDMRAKGALMKYNFSNPGLLRFYQPEQTIYAITPADVQTLVENYGNVPEPYLPELLDEAYSFQIDDSERVVISFLKLNGLPDRDIDEEEIEDPELDIRHKDVPLGTAYTSHKRNILPPIPEFLQMGRVHTMHRDYLRRVNYDELPIAY